MYKTLTTLTALGLLAAVSQQVAAGTIDCPDTDGDYASVTTTESSLTPTCVDAGTGNESAADFGPEYVLLSKDDGPTSDGLFPTALDITTYNTSEGDFGFSGGYTINYNLLTGYTNFIFVLKRGQGDDQVVNHWVAFNLDGSASGTWALSPADTQALSHGAIYGTAAVVPIPAAAWLFGSALLGVIGLGYRRKPTA
jgi:hypothetical protein